MCAICQALHPFTKACVYDEFSGVTISVTDGSAAPVSGTDAAVIGSDGAATSPEPGPTSAPNSPDGTSEQTLHGGLPEADQDGILAFNLTGQPATEPLQPLTGTGGAPLDPAILAGTGTVTADHGATNSVSLAGSPAPGEGVAAAPAALPVYTYDQIAYQLTNGYWEASGMQSRSFVLGDDRTLNVDISGLTAAGQSLARSALDAWKMMTGITFVEVQAGVGSGPVVTEAADAAASTATAYTIVPNGSFSGAISGAGDRDWVKVTLTAGQTYTITLKGTNVSGELADPYLRLMNSAGTQVAFNDDSGSSDSAITFTATTGGTYYLVAGAYGDSASGTYKMSVLDGDQAADIVFDDASTGAYTSSSVSGHTINSAHVNIGTAWLTSYGTGLNTYSFQTYIHEIGHALGLGHAGNYNGSATYATDADYANDSWQASVMSYFNQTANTYINDTKAYTLTPMMADILAIQNIYGTPVEMRDGNTIYGEHSTAGGYLDGFANLLTSCTLTLFDTGGIDTLDLGTRAGNQRVDLRPGGISDVAGKIGNLSIALNTVIENVITASGADTITGNGAGNRITTQAGADLVLAGAGFDTVLGGDGNDMLSGEGDNDWLYGGAGNDQLTGGGGIDMLYGGLGADTFIVEIGSGRDALRDFSISEGDRISLDADLWGDARTSQDIVADFGHINAMGRAVFEFGGARLVVWDFTDLSSLVAQIDIF